ncbi:MAG: hypothetical protein M5U19_07325 [Microthrixaceae bacterium]|nr:hypothetical protein [Microthrixaceae bacterium]
MERAWGIASESGSEELKAAVIIEGCAGTVSPGEPWLTRAEDMIAGLEEGSVGRVLLTAMLCYVRCRDPGPRARELAEWAMARLGRLDSSGRRVVTEYCIPVIAASSPAERVVDLARGSVADARASGNEFEVIETLSVLRRASSPQVTWWPARPRLESTRNWSARCGSPGSWQGWSSAGR